MNLSLENHPSSSPIQPSKVYSLHLPLPLYLGMSDYRPEDCELSYLPVKKVQTEMLDLVK